MIRASPVCTSISCSNYGHMSITRPRRRTSTASAARARSSRPGDASRPIANGLSHFDRYADAGESLVVLRVATRALLDHNRERALRFTRVNSGSARHHGGEPARRGGATFMTAEAFSEPPGAVKELVIADYAALPATVELAGRPGGPWRPL